MRRGILSHCLRIFLICWAIGTFYIIFVEIVPVTRTHFWSYRSFKKRADFTIYAKELPESAHNIRYYFYEGFLTDKSGYRVSYSSEDYEQMKSNRLAVYNSVRQEVYCFDDGVKQYLNRKQMEERRIDFLNKLLPEKQDNGQYYYLAYDLFETEEVYAYHCVLCNDETCEMIEISYHGPN